MFDSRETKADNSGNKVVGVRRLKEAMAKPASTRIFTVANQKGGVGKTTTTVNIAAALSMGGLRTLVIDLDPQGNASTALGVPHRDTTGIYEVLMGDESITSVIQKVAGFPSLDCIPSNSSLANAEVNLVSMVARELRLKEALEEISPNYDYIFIDCPPSLNMLTVNAMAAADSVLVPMQCEYFALEGLTALVETINKLAAVINGDLKIEGILRTMYDPRNRLANDVSEQLKQHFGDKVYRAVIPRNVRLAEAPSFGTPVMYYDKSSTGAKAYLALAGEILRRSEKKSSTAANLTS